MILNFSVLKRKMPKSALPFIYVVLGNFENPVPRFPLPLKDAQMDFLFIEPDGKFEFTDKP